MKDFMFLGHVGRLVAVWCFDNLIAALAYVLPRGDRAIDKLDT